MTDKKQPWRPRKYDCPNEFVEKATSYIEEQLENSKPITWTGMALYMGFSSRQSIGEYKQYDGFSDAVMYCHTLVEHAYEEFLMHGGGASAIFGLKQFSWDDKQAIEHSSPDGSMAPGGVNINVTKKDLQDVLNMM